MADLILLGSVTIAVAVVGFILTKNTSKDFTGEDSNHE